MESRVQDAVMLFESGFNCAQSVFAAYADLFGMDRETALKLACPMGAGVCVRFAERFPPWRCCQG